MEKLVRFRNWWCIGFLLCLLVLTVCVPVRAYDGGWHESVADQAKALKITRQPEAVAVVSGAKATVRVEAVGDGLEYQWYYAAKGSSKFTKTDAFTSNTYAVAMTSARNGRQIYCVVTDRYGNSVKTDVVTIGMKTELKILQQPSSVRVASGQVAKVSFKAQGDGLSYKWYYKNDGGKSYAYTGSFKTASYKLTMTAARDGRKVYCVVTDKYGDSVRTNTVSLRMRTELKILQQPGSVFVRDGETAKVGFTAQGDGLTYKWYYAKKGSTKYTVTNTFTSNSYSVAMNASRDGRKIYCVVTDRYGASVKTKTVSLNLRKELRITRQPVSVKAPEGTVAKVSVVVQGDGLKYQWYYSSGDAFLLTTTFTSGSYSISMNEARSGRKVYCVITDRYGDSVRTDTVTLSLAAPLVITTQPVNANAPVNALAIVRVSAQGDGLTYRWYRAEKDSDSFQLAEGFDGVSFAETMDDAHDGVRAYCVITDAYGRSVTTNTVTLKLRRNGGMGGPNEGEFGEEWGPIL